MIRDFGARHGLVRLAAALTADKDFRTARSVIGEGMAIACLQAFLDTPFAGGRHQHRVDKLSAKESV